MQTIRITITSEKPANVVLTEKKPDADKARKKKPPYKKLQTLFGMQLQPGVLVGKSEGEEKPCD